MSDEKMDAPEEHDDPVWLGASSRRPLTARQVRQLVAPLNPARVARRSQGGAQLSYLEAWDVRASMNRIFGFGGWSAEVTESKVLRIDDVEIGQQKRPGFRVLAYTTVQVFVHQLGATYSDTGAASQQGPDIGEVTDFALKTSSSDAFKRACMNLGTQFGLSLYNNGDTADVVRVVLAPGQHETLAEVREADGAKQSRREAPAPGEDPADDLPMAMSGEGAAALRRGFERSPQ